MVLVGVFLVIPVMVQAAGDFVLPFEGEYTITQGFSTVIDKDTGQTHEGIDYAPVDKSIQVFIHAVADGLVVKAEDGYNNTHWDPDTNQKRFKRCPKNGWHLSNYQDQDSIHALNSCSALDSRDGIACNTKTGEGAVVARENPDGSPAMYICNAWYHYGNQVFILHEDDRKSIYAHCEKGSVQVESDQWVNQWDALCVMGNTGFSTGKHLHLKDEKWY